MNEQEIRELVQTLLGADASAPAAVSCPSPSPSPPPSPAAPGAREVLVEASARHLHLTDEAVRKLFGPDATLGRVRDLSQPGEYLSDKRVRIVTPKGQIDNVAVLGPVRPAIQAELSLTDGRALGLRLPVNLSGDLTGAADVYLVGTAGMLEARGCAIAARAHIHATPGDAARLGIRDGQVVRVRVKGRRPIVLEQILVRVKETFDLAMHIDFDEANACALEPGCMGEILD